MAMTWREAIDIDEMLLGELDLEALDLSGVQAAVPLVAPSPDSMASATTVTTATVTATTAPAMATMAATTQQRS